MVAIRKIEARGRYSRSGRTYFVRRIKIVTESNKHVYEYDCLPSPEEVWICTLTIDGEKEDIIEDPPIVKEALAIIENQLNVLRTETLYDRVTIEMPGKGVYTEVAVEPIIRPELPIPRVE